MLQEIVGPLATRELLAIATTVVFFAGLVWFFRASFEKLARRLAQKVAASLGDTIVSSFRGPATVVLILLGIRLALVFLPLSPVYRFYVSKALSTLLLMLGAYAVATLLNAVMKWYQLRVLPGQAGGSLSSGVLQVFRVLVAMAAVISVVLLGLQLWWDGTLVAMAWMAEHGWRLALIAVLTLVVVLATGAFIPRFVVAGLTRRPGESDDECRKRSATLSRVLVGTGQIAVLLIAAFMLLSELDINIAPILAGAGVAGIALGFGAQSLVKDIISGLFIIMENQYRVGDVVRIADTSGLVQDIDLRRTVLRDLDGIVHVVPNGQIRVSSNFTNQYSRVNLNISVAYKTDLDQAIAVINGVGKELAEDPAWASSILSAPKVLRVDKLGDSGIELKILGDTVPLRQWDVTGELRLRLKRALDKAGIEIPWPHTKVYFGDQVPSFRDNSPANRG